MQCCFYYIAANICRIYRKLQVKINKKDLNAEKNIVNTIKNNLWFHILGVAMSNNIKRVEPIIDIAGTWYKDYVHLIVICRNIQFYYHFAYPKRFQTKAMRIFQPTKDIAEHISFHADGHFQLTLKQDKDKHLERHQSLDGVFLPKET